MKNQLNKMSSEAGSRSAGQKIFKGTVISTKMQKTVVVRIRRFSKHPIYKKLIRRDKNIKADTGGLTVAVNDTVRIGEVNPLSKTKCFKVLEVIKK